MCGIGGGIGDSEMARPLAEIGVALAHRGRSSFGIVTDSDGELHTWYRSGSITSGLPADLRQTLPGDMGIVHDRYGTSGGNGERNFQPFSCDTKFGMVVIAHNGNMEQAESVRSNLLKLGTHFRSDSDTEVIFALIARSRATTFERALKQALKQLSLSYCLLIMTKDGLYAVRDPSGNRRLFMLKTGTATYFASEDAAFINFPPGNISELAPGEMIFVSRKNPAHPVRTPLFRPWTRQALCSFEAVYFARPDTTMPSGETHGAFRVACGQALAQQFGPIWDNREDPDNWVISAIPDSGSDAASGFAAALHRSTLGAVKRNHYVIEGTVNRGFIGKTELERTLNAEHKFVLNRSFVSGKHLVLIDDSIVRGTTLKRLIEKLRAMGARSVHIMVASPPVIGRCMLGISIRSEDELIAPNRTSAQIAEMIGADTVFYLPRADYRELLAEYGMPSVCDGCFTGCYPSESTHA
jgi:amidophosphoribosyltransferase